MLNVLMSFDVARRNWPARIRGTAQLPCSVRSTQPREKICKSIHGRPEVSYHRETRPGVERVRWLLRAPCQSRLAPEEQCRAAIDGPARSGDACPSNRTLRLWPVPAIRRHRRRSSTSTALTIDSRRRTDFVSLSSVRHRSASGANLPPHPGRINEKAADLAIRGS
jgi:hypothetical protein